MFPSGYTHYGVWGNISQIPGAKIVRIDFLTNPDILFYQLTLSTCPGGEQSKDVEADGLEKHSVEVHGGQMTWCIDILISKLGPKIFKLANFIDFGLISS